MKTKENTNFINKIMERYKALTQIEKIVVIIVISVFTLGNVYALGKAVGKFMYYISH